MLGRRPDFKRERPSLEPLRSLPSRAILEAPLRLPGIREEALRSLGIETVGDLLEHLPHTHRDPAGARPIAELEPGQPATVVASVEEVREVPARGPRRARIEARVADASGALVAVWWGRRWLRHRLRVGDLLRLEGVPKEGGRFWVRDHEWLDREAAARAAGNAPSGESRPASLVPVHPASAELSARRLRHLVRRFAARALACPDPLPARLRAREGLPDRAAALLAAHFPRSFEEAEAARARLAFEELLLLQLALGRRRNARRARARAPAVEAPATALARWLETLPFEPTGDQRRAISVLTGELAGERPMNRLLMGEVGSGKTLVAAAAMLQVARAGYQAALMAPTETLAEQHHRTLDRLLGGTVPLALVTSTVGSRRRREALERLASGELPIVVGTHALIEPGVRFAALALAVIDEQHRFGVRQRAALERKGPNGLVPHVLHMTATPIPRTLALTAYGELDVTVLRELPRGRRPVETLVLAGEEGRREAMARVRAAVARGHQAFVVCPLVEESEALAARAATAEFERLTEGELRGLRLGLVHGQLPAAQRQETMARFAQGEIDVLVATSVVEVGIDVPNATVIVVEEAHRWGIAQLHQLRGRVGRGTAPSVCILIGDPSLPRLRALAAHSDGFRLAEIDLQLRGSGDVLGTRQHGLPSLRFARLPSDAPLLERAHAAAAELLARDPELADPEHQLLAAASEERFGAAAEPIPG